MSWEEDFLMRRVGEIVTALKGVGVLHECESCTTLYADDLDTCPNCGHEKGEPCSEAMSGTRPTPLGVESTAGANALPPETVHGGADPNVVHARFDNTGEGSGAEAEESGETIDGQPATYDSANVETLRGELDRRGVFVPGGTRKADLVGMLREHDAASTEGQD